MRPQVLAMFREEYGVDEKSFEKFFDHLYEHPFQKDKCIRIAALDGDKVAGFLSFFYWPYTLNATTYGFAQMGNGLIGKEYRGIGLFQKLIQFFFEDSESGKTDFLLGFPVEASFRVFKKNKWLNILNLKWYVRVINPVAFLLPFGMNKNFAQEFIPTRNDTNRLKLSEDNEFVKWKNGLKSLDNAYYYFTAEVGEGKKITFELRLQTRKKIIKELIIGKIHFEQGSEPFLSHAIKYLVRNARKSLSISIISIAINEECKKPNYSKAIEQCGFKKIDKEIYFILKPLKGEHEFLADASLWDLGRADIDTW